MQRYSKKRQAILDCLKSTSEHPTAEWIYERLKPAFPKLSLATVYRNLRQLKDEGYVRSMGTVLGQERFDASTQPHAHAVCTHCGKITDVEVPIPSQTVCEAEAFTGFDIHSANLMLYGLCSVCKEGCQNER